MRISINLNDDICFRPTKAAFAQYEHCSTIRRLPVDKNGFAKMPLWEFMSIFGSMYYMGNMNLPTENNVIEIGE
jgi:hypothetical protein